MSTACHTVVNHVEAVEVRAYDIPTDYPEADGTASWDKTTLVLVEAKAGGQSGLGYTYADVATGRLIREKLVALVTGRDIFAIPETWGAMVKAVRNLGRPGIAAMAISAVDNALWDLKAKLLDLPLATLLGTARAAAPIYGSGGFTSYPLARLREQLRTWAQQGIPRVKMKVGTHPSEDLDRVRAARQAIGPDAALFVDANGAYQRKQALYFAERLAELAVSWFEEPVPSDDLNGLRYIRDRAPAGMDIAAGEYGYDEYYFHRMLAAGAVDVLQADVTRCLGITGFLRVAVLADAHHLDISAHCAPTQSLHPCCAVTNFRNLEYFHDHVRIEHMLFDGAITPVDGSLSPDFSRPGIGAEFKSQDAEPFAVDL